MSKKRWTTLWYKSSLFHLSPANFCLVCILSLIPGKLTVGNSYVSKLETRISEIDDCIQFYVKIQRDTTISKHIYVYIERYSESFINDFIYKIPQTVIRI